MYYTNVFQTSSKKKDPLNAYFKRKEKVKFPDPLNEYIQHRGLVTYI